MESPRAGTGSSAREPVLLHGDLMLFVLEARRLPNLGLFSEHLRRLLSAFRVPFPPSDFPRPEERRRLSPNITRDPYVIAYIGCATVAHTRVIFNSEDPEWQEHFRIPLAHCAAALVLHVMDNDVFCAKTIGTVSIPTARIASGEEIRGWFPILGPDGKPPKAGASLHLAIRYTPVQQKLEYQHGIAGDAKTQSVRDAYFPLRRGGSVTLYQDAHVREGDLPAIKLEKGAVFKHEKCWEDICHAILEAHYLIYVVGWSIYHKVKLVREPTRPIPTAGRLTLGELLKFKAEEGVRVCMLVWDDKTSHDNFFFKSKGVMHTHDEETRKFFKNSSVHCVLSPRYGSNKLSIVKQHVVGTLFSHHQKCILADTQASRYKRKITAFTGGLDLCDGRYDTPVHGLFRDLDTVYLNDIHNPTFSTGSKCPRQPWHDLHCKIEGPAAYDILKNFEQRWRKATKWQWRKLSKVHDDVLVKLKQISWIHTPTSSASDDHPSLWVSSEEDPENWHVQVFRSIDSGSVKGFPSNVHEAFKMNLVCQKDLVVDKSIHTAYVEAIRSAQHFIYIENQYFLGSSYAWPSYTNPGADNLIPMELALKVANKIRAKERFAVYVVIPMWPEGDPNFSPVQEILYWQAQTIQMMYDIIAKELKSMNIENAYPQDYLNFYCLGKREVTKDNCNQNSQYLDRSSGSLSRKFQRFMIYVHAKGMIVDDEYVIIGSANINQRSMSGSRDTELAIGAYQPHQTWNKLKRHPCGQVYGYRMSLWAEHLGMLQDCFQEPNSLDCVRSVNKIAEENWSRYAADEMKPLTGHLLRYPIKVEENGKISHLPNQEHFPDVGGRILGSLCALPNTIITM